MCGRGASPVPGVNTTNRYYELKDITIPKVYRDLLRKGKRQRNSLPRKPKAK